MTAIENLIEHYLISLSAPKQSDLRLLHNMVLRLVPKTKLWFLDGKNEAGKVVSNPNIGYGQCKLQYADGSEREFYQLGLSANSSGISIYVFGQNDKQYLINKFGSTLGKAQITGYCIKFKKISDLNQLTLENLITDSLSTTHN